MNASDTVTVANAEVKFRQVRDEPMTNLPKQRCVEWAQWGSFLQQRFTSVLRGLFRSYAGSLVQRAGVSHPEQAVGRVFGTTHRAHSATRPETFEISDRQIPVVEFSAPQQQFAGK